MAQINIEDANNDQEVLEQECVQETQDTNDMKDAQDTVDAQPAEDEKDRAVEEEMNDAADGDPTDASAETEETCEEEGCSECEDAPEAEAVQEEQASDEQAAPTENRKEGGLKGLFKKKDKKDKKDQMIDELTDRVKRQMAEFDNFRKRTEKEKAAMYEVGAKSVIEKILPVVDNFERGLATAENSEDPFVEGMQKIYKQLMTTLESLDVKPIEAVGQEFNPDLHNAVMHVDDDSVGENIVVEELQKGYKYRDSVVRYSMVKVAN